MVDTPLKVPYYINNPDVVLREEDQYGGLLFNPDTNNIRVLNQTGLFIYKQCNGKNNLTTIVTAVQTEFDQAPADQVTDQVRGFIDEMVSAGFIGMVEEQLHAQ